MERLVFFEFEMPNSLPLDEKQKYALLSMCPTAACTGRVGTQRRGQSQPAALACLLPVCTAVSPELPALHRLFLGTPLPARSFPGAMSSSPDRLSPRLRRVSPAPVSPTPIPSKGR